MCQSHQMLFIQQEGFNRPVQPKKQTILPMSLCCYLLFLIENYNDGNNSLWSLSVVVEVASCDWLYLGKAATQRVSFTR